MIAYLYVHEITFRGNNPKIFHEFKKAMTRDSEMTDIGHMSYFL